jgi:hypothetical protein
MMIYKDLMTYGAEVITAALGPKNYFPPHGYLQFFGITSLLVKTTSRHILPNFKF